MSEKDRWEKLIAFLQRKLKTQEELVLIEKVNPCQKDKEKDKDRPERRSKETFHSDKKFNQTCYICGESGHQLTRDHRGKNVVQYFCCKKFADMAPAERFRFLKEKGLCHQCLAPGAPCDINKHKVDCFSKYCCKHKSHEKHTKKKHVLVCEERKHSENNRNLLNEYKEKCILNLTEKDK